MSRSSTQSRRMSRTARPLVWGLAVLILSLTLVVALSAAPVEAASEASIEKQLGEIREDLADVRADLKKAEAARKAALGDLSALDQSLDYAQSAYDAAHRAYSDAAEKLSQLQAELAQVVEELRLSQEALRKTQSDLAAQQETLCDRMVGLYKSGGTMGYLAALVGGEGDSLVEVVDRFRLLSTIADQDAELMERIQGLKERIAEQTRALESERARVASLEADQAAVTKELQSADEECKAALDGIEAARAAKKAALASIEQDRKKWAEQEDQLLADSDRIEALLRQTKSTPSAEMGKGALSWPVPGPVTSGFGYRIHPIFKVQRLHTGIDLAGSTGDPIKAAAAGTVVYVGWRGGYGKCTIIDHGGGLATLYAHQSSIGVSSGQVVTRGVVIGRLGSTGYSTGPHLHFEVRLDGSPVDPMNYL